MRKKAVKKAVKKVDKKIGLMVSDDVIKTKNMDGIEVQDALVK